MKSITKIIKRTVSVLRFLFKKRLYISSETIVTTLRDFHFKIDQVAAEKYRSVVEAGAISEQNIDMIHPLYLTKISWHIVESLNEYLEQPIEPKLLKMLVHLSDHFEYLEPLHIDHEYQVKSRLCLIAPHRKGTRLTVRFEYYQANKLKVIEHTTGLLFGVKCKGPKRLFGELPQNDRVNEKQGWSRNISIAKKLPYDYAKKAEIDAPIHTDPKFAKSIGLPDIILQGTCIFATAVSSILKEFGINFDRVKSLSVNFTGMLVTPNQICVQVLFQSDERIVFKVLDKDGNAVIKGGNILFAKYHSKTE